MPQPKLKPIYQLTEEEYHQHTSDYDGICLACGEWSCGGVEPDARGYECDGCGMRKVYGAEEALMMGRLDLVGEEE